MFPKNLKTPVVGPVYMYICIYPPMGINILYQHWYYKYPTRRGKIPCIILASYQPEISLGPKTRTRMEWNVFKHAHYNDRACIIFLKHAHYNDRACINFFKACPLQWPSLYNYFIKKKSYTVLGSGCYEYFLMYPIPGWSWRKAKLKFIRQEKERGCLSYHIHLVSTLNIPNWCWVTIKPLCIQTRVIGLM
jgi:hypothetical protein